MKARTQMNRRSEAKSHSSAGIGIFWKLDFREMMLIFGLMLLLQTAACLELNCRFDQSDPCYAALGHKLNLLMVDASKYKLQLIKRINKTQDDPVCRVKNDSMRNCDLYKNRPDVTVINGTLIINRVIRADSGNYTLKLELSDGTETSTDLQVIVEAPIGSVEVSISCSSNQSSVFCSSEGDQITYNWTLNGKILEQGPMVRNITIQLNGGTLGNISCSVKNHVSHTQKTIRVEPCPEPTTPAVTSSLTSAVTSSTQMSDYGTSFSSFSSAGMNLTHTPPSAAFPLMFGMNVLGYLIAGCAALILILLFITVCYVYKKKRLKSTPAAAGDTELTYAEKKETESLPAADVEYAAVKRQTKRKERKEKKEKKEKEEEEVQYGEVKFTPNHSNALQQPQEECVYSQVVRR